jgi:hypothetical protein
MRFENFDVSGFYDRYQRLVDSVTEWKISTNGPIFRPLIYKNEIVVGASAKLIKKKYKNVEEAMYLGKYCSGFINEECVVVIDPVHKGIDARLVLFYERSNAALEEINVDFRLASVPEKRISTLGALAKYIDLPDGRRAEIRVGERENFSVSIYTFAGDGKPIYAKVISKGWENEDVYYFHYKPDGEMYKISNDEAGVHVCFPLSSAEI